MTGTIEVMPERNLLFSWTCFRKTLLRKVWPLHPTGSENYPTHFSALRRASLTAAGAGFDSGQSYTVKIDRYTPLLDLKVKR